MINIEQITARLAKLPDQALQQYAMMHKEDPYIMALAVSESNRRKQIRAAGQVQAQEQPKVADQALMDMAPQQSPDEAGIASLAAGDMNFADGGIVAYAGGGEVERYNGESGSLTGVRYADVPASIAALGVPVAIYRQAADLATRLGTSVSSVLARMGYDVAKAGTSGVTGAAKLAATAPGQVILAGGVPASQFATDVMAANPQLREAYTDNPMLGAMDPNGALAAAILDQSKAAPEKKSMKSVPSSLPADYSGPKGQSQPTPQQIEAAVARPKIEANTGLGGTKEAADLREATRLGTTLAAPAAAPSIADAKNLANQFLDTKAAESQYNKFLAEDKAEIDKQRAEFNKGKPTGKAYSKYEEMLQKEEAGAGKEKDEALGLAIFKAGLGMMAGSSPHAFENIGKGAMAGLDDYSSAMKDMKKAARERQKAMADIDNARRAEERDDWKSAREFDNKASERLSKAREFAIRGIMEVTGKSAEIASSIYKTQVTEGGQDRRAQLQANTSLATARMREGVRGELTEKDRAAIADKAMDNINATVKANTALQIKVAKDPAYLQTLVRQETARLMAAAEGRTIAPAPGAPSPGGTSNAGWGKAQVVNP